MDENRTQMDFKAELAALATLRDELKLKMHLVRADVKSQVDDLERRWLLAEEQVRRTKEHVEQDTALVEHRLQQLVTDLKVGYQDIKRAFQAV